LLVLALRQQGRAGVVHRFGAGGQLDQLLEGGRRLVGVSGLVCGEAEIEETLDVNRVVLAQSLELLRGLGEIGLAVIQQAEFVDRLREVAGPARIIELLNGSEQERFAQLQVARLNSFDEALVRRRRSALRAANYLLLRVRRREIALVNDVPGQLPLPILQVGERAAVIERLGADQPPL